MIKTINIFVVLFLFVFVSYCSAEEAVPKISYFEAEIVDIQNKQSPSQNVSGISNKIISAIFQDASGGEKKITLDDSGLAPSVSHQFEKGDRILISKTTDQDGTEIFTVVDFIRSKQLFMLFISFFVLVLLVARFRGVFSFVGMIISYFVIMQIIIPQILNGNNPVFISILGCAIIVPITFYLSHGINKKTTIAIVSTILALSIVALFAHVAIVFTRLTGLASEEAGFIQAFKGNDIKMTDLLLAGIMISTLGVLDDITISQASVVDQLTKTNSKLSTNQLFMKAMSVGRDHIGSLVNTLVLVYAGASLPLFLLFADQHIAVSAVVNFELIATEIVKTIVSSFGLVLSVPIATLLSARLLRK